MDSIKDFDKETYEFLSPDFRENTEKEKSYSVYKDTFQKKEIKNSQIVYLKSYNNKYLKSTKSKLSLEENDETLKKPDFEFTIFKYEGSNFFKIYDNKSKYIGIDEKKKLTLTNIDENNEKQTWKLIPYNDNYYIESVYYKNFYLDASFSFLSKGIKESNKWSIEFKEMQAMDNSLLKENEFVNEKEIEFSKLKDKYINLINQYKTNEIKKKIYEYIESQLIDIFRDYKDAYIIKLINIDPSLKDNITKKQSIRESIDQYMLDIKKNILNEIQIIKTNNLKLITQLNELKTKIIEYNEKLNEKFSEVKDQATDSLLKNLNLLKNFQNNKVDNENINKEIKLLENNYLKLDHNQEFLEKERNFYKIKSLFLLLIVVIVFGLIFSAIISIIIELYNIYT